MCIYICTSFRMSSTLRRKQRFSSSTYCIKIYESVYTCQSDILIRSKGTPAINSGIQQNIHTWWTRMMRKKQQPYVSEKSEYPSIQLDAITSSTYHKYEYIHVRVIFMYVKGYRSKRMQYSHSAPQPIAIRCIYHTYTYVMHLHRIYMYKEIDM